MVPAALPPVGTLDEIAYQMTHGFWGGSSHRFNVTQGGTLTVNLTGITADARPVALAALAVWTDIIGVNFQEVTVGGQIKFDDLAIGTGAFSESEWGEDGFTLWATVNVSVARLGTGPGIMRGGLHTYIHEIGHALGLGHTAFANSGTAAATYPNDAIWANDGSAISVMSYFDNGENTYYANQGFSHLLVTTPQVADIIAAGNLYGLSTITRTGDTTYGFNNNSGRLMFDAAQYSNLAYTIFDSGGIDTLDYSGFFSTSTINLNQEAFSSIGGRVGNVVIARGTVIENAIGGHASDKLIGNAADNILTGGAGIDTLTGGAGADTFRDTAAGLNGDTIVDFSAGDRIVITDANLAGFSFSVTGNTLTFTGGSLTLATVPAGTLIAIAAAGGGVELRMAPPEPKLVTYGLADFNGDGRADILWRSDDGVVANWLAQADGTFADNSANTGQQIPLDWHIAGSGDFNGDGRADIMWRSDGGIVTQWLGTANGGFADNHANTGQFIPTDWHIVETGDFNGDGRDDIMWRSDAGVVTNWLGQANGGFANNHGNTGQLIPTDWHIVGSGDFDGDGRDDILWRSDSGVVTDWLGQANGGFANNHANTGQQIPLDWHIIGTGDFNGDGRDDILWRSEGGTIVNWLGQANGGFLNNQVNTGQLVPEAWELIGTGDVNADGRDDVVWRTETGLVEWLGQGNGGFTGPPAAALAGGALHATHINSDLFYLA